MDTPSPAPASAPRPPAERQPDPRARLVALERGGATTADALALFDALPTVTVEELTGRWRGSGLPTGHPLDGLLEAFGWYGKEFIDRETVHPLLFTDGAGRPFPIDSRLLPIGRLPPRGITLLAPLFGLVRPLLRTRRPRARLRLMEHRGQVSAAMLYDFLPIHDHFRRVDGATLLGLMDLRGVPQPFFFVLRRA